MKTITEKLSNGNEITYQVLENGHCYKIGTNSKVVSELEKAWYTDSRIKVYYGDKETGRDWHEEYGTTGTVGFSTGRIKIPLMIANVRSTGGGAILDDCIIRLKVNGIEVYRAHNYQNPQIEMIESDMQPEYKFNLNINGNLYSRHKSEKSAKRLFAKLS